MGCLLIFTLNLSDHTAVKVAACLSLIFGVLKIALQVNKLCNPCIGHERDYCRDPRGPHGTPLSSLSFSLKVTVGDPYWQCYKSIFCLLWTLWNWTATTWMTDGFFCSTFLLYFFLIYYYYFNLFCLCWVLAEARGLLLVECGIQFPDQGSNLVLPALGARSLNAWTLVQHFEIHPHTLLLRGNRPTFV